MLNTVAMADDYFSTNYFSADTWASITTDEKERLLTHAEMDISTALNSELDPSVVIHTEKPYTPVQMAVFEWALYIYNNKAKLTKKMNSTNAGLASIEVDGVGKETYAISGGRGDAYFNCLWSSSAGRYLSLIEHDVRIVR